MNDDTYRGFRKEIQKITVGITAMKASGGYKTRKHIHLSDTELKEYIQKIETQIYTAFISNLLLQERFASELEDPKKIEAYNADAQQVLKKLQKDGLF